MSEAAHTEDHSHDSHAEHEEHADHHEEHVEQGAPADAHGEAHAETHDEHHENVSHDSHEPSADVVAKAVSALEKTGEVPDVLKSKVVKNLLDVLLSVRDGIGKIAHGLVVETAGQGILKRFVMNPIRSLIKALFSTPGDAVRLGKYIATAEGK